MNKIISGILKTLFIISIAYFTYSNCNSIATEASTLHISFKYITYVLIGIFIGWAIYKAIHEIFILMMELYNFLKWLFLTVLDKNPGEFTTYVTQQENIKMQKQLEIDSIHQENKRRESIKEEFYKFGTINDELSYLFGLEDGQIAGELKGIRDVYNKAYEKGKRQAFFDQAAAAEKARREKQKRKN